MAGLFFRASSGLVATTTAEKGIMMLTAPANQRIEVHEIIITHKAAATVTCDWRLTLATTAGTSTALTLLKVHSGDDETVQSVGAVNFTALPTLGADKVGKMTVYGTRSFVYRPKVPLEIKGGERLIFLAAVSTAGFMSVDMLCEE